MKRLKELREKHNLTIKEMADKLGFSYFNYFRYEKGTRTMSFEILIKICKVFNVSADYLLELKDTEN